MSNFDDDIRKALHTEGEDLAGAGDEGMLRQVTASFKSRMRYWVAVTWFVTLLMLGLCVFAVIMFFQAEQVRDWIMYATIFLYGVTSVGLLKMWNWMEMNRNTHTREIKRLEIQIAKLAERVRRPVQ